MDETNKTINDELRPCAIEIMTNGITKDNYNRIINLLQSIMICPDNTVLDDVDFCFLISSLYYIDLDTNLIKLIKNSLRDRFLYFQLNKVIDATLNEDTIPFEWVIEQEVVESSVGKEIIYWNKNQFTGEKKELYRQNYKNPNELDLNTMFSDILNLSLEDKQ